MTDNNTSPSNSNAGTNRNQAALDEHDNAHYDKGDSKSDLSSSEHSLTAVLEQLEPDKDAGKVNIGDIMDTLKSKGFGPLIFAPVLFTVFTISNVD